MLRIEKVQDRGATTLRLNGRIQSEHLDDIHAQMDDDSVRIILDLSEVTLVDVEVIQSLGGCEKAGIELVDCPPFVREWILRERAEETRDSTRG
jgi:anti-anti-sigma regulatory factor